MKFGSIGTCVCLFLAGTAMVTGTPACYFLQSSGCGSESSFCQNNQNICDVTYSSSPDTGCGLHGPDFEEVPRKCWKIHDPTTRPCDAAPPAGYLPTGCRWNGGCCYASHLEPLSEDEDTIDTPTGGVCGCDEQSEG